MTYNNLTDAMREILDDPYGKVITLSEDYHLWTDGNQAIEANEFVLFTPSVFVARTTRAVCLSGKQMVERLPLHVGYFSPNKFLVSEVNLEPQCYFWDGRYRPETPLPFILYAQFDGFVEAYIATPTIGAPLYFHWPSERSEQLFGLCADMIAASCPEDGYAHREFLLEVAFGHCEYGDESDDDDAN